MRYLIALGFAMFLLSCLPTRSAAQVPDFFEETSVPISAQAWWAPTQAAEGPLVALVAVVMDHPEGIKSWPSADQDVLSPEIDQIAIRTEVSVRSVGGVLGTGAIQWPTPKPYPVPDVSGSGGTVDAPVYTGRVVIYVPVLIDRATAESARTLELVVGFQACDEAVCFIPEQANVLAPLPAFGQGTPPSDAAGIFPATIDDAIALVVSGLYGELPPAEPSTALEETPAEAAQQADTRNKFLGFVAVPTPDSIGGILGIILLGVVGGFVLNLTPCVLPVIPIKVMTLSQHAGSPGKTLLLGIWMALGVVAFWVGLGIPAALLGKAVGAIFGVWWFTVGVGVIIAVMSLGLMGLFTIQLPQSVYKVNPKADSPWGSFVFGVMTGVLGLPCFGLVAGALLVSATEIPPLVTMLIFTALGVGMALPYLILSMNPKWVEVLPRTGPASELVKQVMGLLLLGAGAYFLATGIQALILDMPWIGRQMHWWAAAIFVAMACAWLAYRTLQITKSIPKRGVFTVLSMLLGGGALLFAYDATGDAKANYLERERHLAEAGEQSGGGAIMTGTWVDYTPQLLERARAEGYVVVVKFTADWCINCVALEQGVLAAEPVNSRLRRDDVVMIKADLTSSRQPAWALMRELGQKAPPVLAVYGPGIEGDTPWLSNGYTSAIVMDAIARGKGQVGVARAN